MEHNIDRSESPKALDRLVTFGVIDLHVAACVRSAALPDAALEALKKCLGTVKLSQLSRSRENDHHLLLRLHWLTMTFGSFDYLTILQVVFAFTRVTTERRG